MSSLSQRLTDGLIGGVFAEFEQAGPPWASTQAKMQYEGFRDYIKPELQKALAVEVATIEADLKGLIPIRKNPKAKHLFTTATGTQVQYVNEPYMNGYNEAIDLIAAAIERYTRGTE